MSIELQRAMAETDAAAQAAASDAEAYFRLSAYLADLESENQGSQGSFSLARTGGKEEGAGEDQGSVFSRAIDGARGGSGPPNGPRGLGGGEGASQAAAGASGGAAQGASPQSAARRASFVTRRASFTEMTMMRQPAAADDEEGLEEDSMERVDTATFSASSVAVASAGVSPSGPSGPRGSEGSPPPPLPGSGGDGAGEAGAAGPPPNGGTPPNGCVPPTRPPRRRESMLQQAMREQGRGRAERKRSELIVGGGGSGDSGGSSEIGNGANGGGGGGMFRDWDKERRRASTLTRRGGAFSEEVPSSRYVHAEVEDASGHRKMRKQSTLESRGVASAGRLPQPQPLPAAASTASSCSEACSSSHGSSPFAAAASPPLRKHSVLPSQPRTMAASVAQALAEEEASLVAERTVGEGRGMAHRKMSRQSVLGLDDSVLSELAREAEEAEAAVMAEDEAGAGRDNDDNDGAGGGGEGGGAVAAATETIALLSAALPALAQLPGAVLPKVVAAFRVRRVRASSVLLDLGQPMDTAYVVKSGTFDLSVAVVDRAESPVLTYTGGMAMAERALYVTAPSRVRLQCRSGSGGGEVYCLGGDEYRSLTHASGSSITGQQSTYAFLMGQLPPARFQLNAATLARLSKRAREVVANDPEDALASLRAGAQAGSIFVLKSGTLSCVLPRAKETEQAPGGSPGVTPGVPVAPGAPSGGGAGGREASGREEQPQTAEERRRRTITLLPGDILGPVALAWFVALQQQPTPKATAPSAAAPAPEASQKKKKKAVAFSALPAAEVSMRKGREDESMRIVEHRGRAAMRA
jgi:hypothetical protein